MSGSSTNRSLEARLARRVSAALAAGALAALALAPATLASHLGATVDCGADGTYTLHATETSNGDWQAPGPGDVLLFEEGGVLIPLELSVNGSLRFSKATVGRDQNGLTEVQCSFQIGTGQLFEVEGLLVAR
jgi:hypothetical protein